MQARSAPIWLDLGTERPSVSSSTSYFSSSSSKSLRPETRHCFFRNMRRCARTLHHASKKSSPIKYFQFQSKLQFLLYTRIYQTLLEYTQKNTQFSKIQHVIKKWYKFKIEILDPNMDYQRVPRLTLSMPRRDQPVLDFDAEMQQSIITDGSSTAPVFALSQQPFLPRRFSFSSNIARQTQLSDRSVFSCALSRTFTLTSLSTTSLAVDEWRRIFDKLDLVSFQFNFFNL